MRIHFLTMLCLAALAAGRTPAAADSRLILPLQYNAYRPVSARALGGGNCWGSFAGLGSLFADPAGLPDGRGARVECGGSAMSAFQSHSETATGASLVVPATVIAAWGVNSQTLSFGARRAQHASLDFSDPVRPQAAEHMEMGVDQLRGGWCLGLGDRVRVGIALGYDQASIDWSDPAHRLAKASANSQSYALGFAADIWRGLSFGLCYIAKTEFTAETGFDYRDTMRTLQLLGAMPAVTGLAVQYQIDSGFTAAAQLELTGWQAVSSGYLGAADWHVGLELEAARWLTFRAGGYSLATAIDPALRENRPDLHNLYFLTAGAGVRYWRINTDLGLATSYPFSGKGLNQNIVAFSLGYSQ